nr:filamentous hemagglutinin N-terminal domain-containing protein [Akkermansiaceae bacterium]
MKPKRLIFHPTPLFGHTLRCGVPMVLGFMVFFSGIDAEAGDILRGGAGGGAGGKPRPGAQGGAPTPAATDAARANARDTLAKTSRTLQSIRDMQAAARQAAIKGQVKPGKNQGITLPKVPNGLGTGGLKPTGGTTKPSSWVGAKNPTQTSKNGKVTVTIEQTQQQALLKWDSFNVGKKTTLNFNQSAGGADAGKWIAFNQVTDPSANPTQILGNITADGQVYIINPNGIIFGGSSRVNARGLTVSSLPINENLIERGLLNNPDGQFLFSGLDMPAGNAGTPAFTAQKPFSADGKYGDITVESGAVLSSPTNSAKVGGRITLVGPNVTNNGTISTPDGQAILAAGLQAGFAAHASTDPSLRGLDVFIGAIQAADAAAYAGKATQNGLIEAPRGAITIAGASIHQNGVLESSTSVSLNGRIDLLAHYDAISNPALGSAGSAGASPFIYQKSGLVQTGTGSLMRILPEWASKETAIGTELALRSRINIEGKAIHLGAESTLLAPNALVNIKAGEWILTGDSTALTSSFESTTGQVYIDRDALVDVSGSSQASVDVGKNIISVDLRGAELANSPLQRDGKLRNETIFVDIRDQGIYQNEMWVGTPLANVSGFANLIQRTVGELTVNGGEINIDSGSSVVLREGAKLDVSGGLIHYKAGTVRTTQLITGGRLVDISTASPDVVYDGIFDGSFTVSNPKFGVNDVYFGALAPDGSRFEAASDQGGNGGTLSITAPEMALDGSFIGKTYAGDRQRLTPPGRSTLNLNFLGRDKTYQTLPFFSPAAPDIVFSSKPSQVAPGEFGLDADGNPLGLDAERSSTVQLSSRLMSRDGFGIVSIDNRDGSITVPEDVRIKAPGEGQISFSASNIIIDGKITAPGGELSFTSNFLDLDTLNQLANTTGGELPEPTEPRGLFKLGSRGVIDTSGLLVDDRKITSASEMGPVFTAGGSVSVRAFSADLQTGGKIDVSGGASIDPRGAVTYGAAGAISVQTGRDTTVTALIGGTLNLGASLQGFSGKSAGSLTLGAPAFQIGSGTAADGVTVLDPEFFNRGGFGTFSLLASGLPSGTPETFVTGVRITEGTVIRPKVMSLVARTTDSTFSLRRVLQAEGVRAPGTLSFSASGAVNPFNNTILGLGEIVLEKGASIRTDVKGSVTLTGDLVTIAGSIIAPGGSISAAGGSRYISNDPNLLLPTTLIGSEAVLSTAGKRLLVPNAFGLRQGQVVAGGSITLGGNLVAESGSLIDVSGASGVLDLPLGSTSLEGGTTGSTSGFATSPVRIDSNGGTITLSGSRMLYVESTLRGEKGGDSAIGGSLSVSSGRFAEFGTITNTAEINLIVRQDAALLGSGIVDSGAGTAATAPDGTALPGIGNLSISSFEDGGFHSLSLLGNVAFEGDVNLRLPGSLRLSSGGVVQADGAVRLTAGYVSIGQSFIPPQAPGDELFLFTQT